MKNKDLTEKILDSGFPDPNSRQKRKQKITREEVAVGRGALRRRWPGRAARRMWQPTGAHEARSNQDELLGGVGGWPGHTKPAAAGAGR